jgi:hypothetical protein
MPQQLPILLGLAHLPRLHGQHLQRQQRMPRLPGRLLNLHSSQYLHSMRRWLFFRIGIDMLGLSHRLQDLHEDIHLYLFCLQQWVLFIREHLFGLCVTVCQLHLIIAMHQLFVDLLLHWQFMSIVFEQLQGMRQFYHLYNL